MLPLILGAAGATWLVSKLVIDREAVRRNFPLVPSEWWKPRDQLFVVKERSLLALKRIEQVSELYQRYASDHPDHTYGLFLMSVGAAQRGDWVSAREHARQLDLNEPTLSVGSWRLVTCCVQLGDKHGAIEAARRFIALEPDSRLTPHFETLITRLQAELDAAPASTAKAKKKSATKRKKARPAASAE